MAHPEIISHPWIEYVSRLNMTQEFKLLLMAGDPEMERIQQRIDPDYMTLRKDFIAKYPLEAAEMAKSCKKNTGDCVLL